ncbi:hypothetical protein GCM10009628_11700 [Paeniglutamicibacter kerguelensis]
MGRVGPSGTPANHAVADSPGSEPATESVAVPRSGRLHHTEIWVRDLEASRATVGWLLEQLGYGPGEPWANGTSYHGANDYIVLESGPDVLPVAHQRCAPGVNHLAFAAGSRKRVDGLAAAAIQRGFRLLFADAHPYAGGPQHYAAYLADPDGFEFELVAGD